MLFKSLTLISALILSFTYITNAVETPTVLIFQFLSSTNCSGTTTFTQLISANQCLDTGSQENFKSIGFNLLTLPVNYANKCYGQIYQFSGCGVNAGDPTQGSYWRQGPIPDGDFLSGGPADTCFREITWADGQQGLGSAMLVCE